MKLLFSFLKIILLTSFSNRSKQTPSITFALKLRLPTNFLNTLAHEPSTAVARGHDVDQSYRELTPSILQKPFCLVVLLVFQMLLSAKVHASLCYLVPPYHTGSITAYSVTELASLMTAFQHSIKGLPANASEIPYYTGPVVTSYDSGGFACTYSGYSGGVAYLQRTDTGHNDFLVIATITEEPIDKNSGPQNCIGNPINAGIGNKFQRDQDFSDSSGNLVLERNYNSRPGTSVSTVGKPWGASWRGSYDRVIVMEGLSAIAYRSDGRSFYFFYKSAINTWQADADVDSVLVQLGNGGWSYTNADNNDIEVYDSTGKLQSITARSGATQILTYSDGTTGINGGYVLDSSGNPTATTLPANLLLRVTNSFGRVLSFGYDASSRVVKMLVPTGEIYHYSYDGNNNLISALYPDNKTRTYAYNEAEYTSGANLPNALTGIIDEKSQRFATFKYDASGRAISTEHAGGAEKVSIAYTTESNGSVTSSAVTDALNTTRTYSFTNILGVVKNIGVSQPCNSGCGAASSTTYDANGNVSSKTDFNGNITNYVYDLTRNLETSRTEAYNTPQARTITTTWHATYRLPTLISEPGKNTAFSYDTNGNLLSKTITDTALNTSRTWSYTYNSLGQVLTADGPRLDVSDITTYTYYTTTSAGNYTMGDLASVTNALGQVTSITKYDANGRPLSITDPNGVVTTLTYSPRGWLTSRTVGTQTTTYAYDGVSQLIKATMPDASYLSYTYDAAHRLTDITDSVGNKTHYTLDAMGNRLQEDTKDPSSNILKTRSRVFDALNRLQKDIGGSSPSTQITQYSYDNNGNLKTLTDPLNHITTNGYDALSRLVTITDPANGVTTNTYNALDQQTQVKDPRLVATNYTIDALGNVSLTQSPDSGSTQNVYDAAGNVTQKTDARGVISNYTYDALNRVTSINYPASTAENVSFTYDSTANGNKGVGRLTGYSNDGGATVFVYDSYGNISQQTEQIGNQYYVTGYQYDNANRVSQITYPSGRIVIYTRNALGQITQVQTKDTNTSIAVTLLSSASYFPFGPLNTLTYGIGVTSTLQRDADYRLSRITANTTPLLDFLFSYDAAGNVTQQADQTGGGLSRAFGYDGLNRVASDTSSVGTWTYQYDANNNRTKRISSNTQTLTYAANSNRMTKNVSTTQTLDAAGNLITNGTKTYVYNNANRLLTYSVSGAVRAQMQYNAIGQRTAKLQISKPMHFHYDLGGRYLGTTAYNSDDTLSQRYEWVYLDDMPIAQVRTNYGSNNAVSSRKTTYIHTDHLNTPRVMSDSAKRIVWFWDGDAYGQTGPNQNPDGDSTTDVLNLRFPGQYYDSETGFYYNGYRDYDPGTGRYVESDPIGVNRDLSNPMLQVAIKNGLLKFDQDDGSTVSASGVLNQPYAYVDANPIGYIDPSGLIKTIFPGQKKKDVPDDDPSNPEPTFPKPSGNAAACAAQCSVQYFKGVQKCSESCNVKVFGYNVRSCQQSWSTWLTNCQISCSDH